MAGLSLSAQERAVFSKVEVTAYWSSAVTSKIPFLQTFEQNPFQPLGAPVTFLRVSNESPIATAWSWGKTGTHTSLHNATEILAQTISDVHAGLGIEDPVVSTRDVKQMRKWDYFPHFDQDALKVCRRRRYASIPIEEAFQSRDVRRALGMNLSVRGTSKASGHAVHALFSGFLRLRHKLCGEISRRGNALLCSFIVCELRDLSVPVAKFPLLVLATTDMRFGNTINLETAITPAGVNP